jgi:Domain of unknown function (DUF1413)
MEYLADLLGEDNLLGALLIGAFGSLIATGSVSFVKRYLPSLTTAISTAFHKLILIFLRKPIIEQVRLITHKDVNLINAYYAAQQAYMLFYLFVCICLLFVWLVSVLNKLTGVSSSLSLVCIAIFFICFVGAVRRMTNIALPALINIEQLNSQMNGNQAVDDLLDDYTEVASQAGSGLQRGFIDNTVETLVDLAAALPAGTKFLVSDLLGSAEWKKIDSSSRKKIGKEFKSLVESGDVGGVMFSGHKGTVSEYIRVGGEY